MGNTLSALLNTISIVVDFFGFLIDSLLTLIIQMPYYLSVLFDSVNILPSFVYPFVVGFIAINLIQYILNRRS